MPPYFGRLFNILHGDKINSSLLVKRQFNIVKLQFLKGFVNSANLEIIIHMKSLLNLHLYMFRRYV